MDDRSRQILRRWLSHSRLIHRVLFYSVALNLASICFLIFAEIVAPVTVLLPFFFVLIAVLIMAEVGFRWVDKRHFRAAAEALDREEAGEAQNEA